MRRTFPLESAFDEGIGKIDNRLTLNLEAVIERSFEDFDDASARNDMTGGAFRNSINTFGPNEDLGFGTKLEMGAGMDAGVCGDCGKQFHSILNNSSLGFESIDHWPPRKSITDPGEMKKKLFNIMESRLGQG